MEKYGCEACIVEFAMKGFIFEPSAQEICEIYLKNKIEGKKLPCKHLLFDENMYEDHSTPWEVFKSDDPRWLINNKTKKVMYVFTELKKKGERVLRKAGCGTWTGQNRKVVRNKQGDAIIGYDRLHTFRTKEVEDGGNWTMHEYTLHPNDYNCAVCKITREEEEVVDQQPSQECPTASSDDNVAHEDLDQEDLEWGSFAETLENIILQQPEESGEACDENINNIGSDQFPPASTDDNVALENLDQEDLEWESFAETLENIVLQQPEESETPSTDDDVALEDMDQEDLDWESFAETLENTILQQPEESGEACHENINNIGSEQLPIEIDDDDVGNENMINVIAQPKGIEDTPTDKYHTDHNLPSDPLSEVFKDYEEPRGMQCHCQDNSNQVVLAEQAQQSERMALVIHLAENFDYYYKEQQQQERMAFILHLAENFDYYYKEQQQQQLQGGQKNLPGKRKKCDYDEEDFSPKKKQKQQPFLCNLQ
ncbi:hypothetical protein DCAR_0623780 [Daucus carota subsp. sativus]|uniref:NAC domain-containing protein n=1 Tax=Daucus carota subsp. sativus TaxID=79200 RepID=A0A164VEZ7_DAUCS|nr:hypothetical protein DCAR_0623780 [Daucus carota subsp. sativus]